MADSLCGPSNALQTFQKHTSVDRTLQQDRIINRQSPSQGFRSQNPNAGALDAEFEAFEANRAAGLNVDFDRFTGFSTPPQNQQRPTFPGPAGGGWAADFQRLRVSDTPPSNVQGHPQAVAARQQSPISGWQNEFLQQRPQPQHAPIQQSPYTSTFQPSLAVNSTFGNSMTQAWPAEQQQTQMHNQPQMEAYDESAFDAAFEEASAQMNEQRSETILQEEEEQESVVTKNEVEEDLQSGVLEQETIRIGSDTIPHSDQADALQSGDDRDELARTAGHLLDAVGNDTSQKFKESSFLALMRRIRDREVQVEGDDFREVTQPLHPGGQHYPQGWTSAEGEEMQMSGARLSSSDLDKFDEMEESAKLHLKYSS